MKRLAYLLFGILLLAPLEAHSAGHGRKRSTNLAASSPITQNLLAAQWSAGVTSYAYYNANPLTSGATSATFEWRMRVPSSWPASEMTILQRDSASSIQKHIMLDIGTSRNLVIYIGSTLAGAWTTCTTGTNSLNVDTTYLIDVVFDGSQATDALRLKVFANNVQQTCTFVNAVPAAMTIPTTAVWTIGATFNGTQGLRSVLVDDIAIWSGIPAATSQITERYNGGLPYDPRLASSMGPPIAYWTFEGANLNEVIGTEGASIGITNGGSITFVNTMQYQTGGYTLATNPGCGVPQTANSQRQLTWSVNEGGVAVVRGAYLAIPVRYDPTRRYPQLFAFHGCSYTGQTYRADAAGPNIEAEGGEGIVSLYPDGLAEPTCVPTNATGWTLTSNSHDIAFFDSMRYAMRAQVCFDESQLLVDGRSMGGGLVQVLSVTRPSYIARFMSVSTAAAPPFAPIIPVVMQQGHNADDATVPVATARAIRDQRIIANGCTNPVTSIFNSNCTTYTCTGAPYEYCEWPTGGHTPNTANAQLAWIWWGHPHPMDTPASFGLAYADQGTAIFHTGQSLALGTAGNPALSTSQTYPDCKFTGATWPWSNLYENTGFETGDAAECFQLRGLRTSISRGYGSQLRAQSGADSDVIKKNGSGTVYDQSWTRALGLGGNDNLSAWTSRTGAALPYRVGGLVITHGESDDDNQKCSGYENFLQQLQSDAQSDATALTGQKIDVPLFVDQLSSGQFSLTSTGNPCAIAQARAAIDYPSRIVLTTPKYHMGNGTTNLYADGQHLANIGYRLLGEMRGLAMYVVRVLGRVWRPLLPTTVAASGTQITVSYSPIPCTQLTSSATTACGASDCCAGTPLVLDTTAVVLPHTGDQPGASLYGFELSCPSAQPPVLTNVAVSGSQVVLTADRNIPTGCSLAYARTGLNGALSGRGGTALTYGSPRGNLRDNMQILGRSSGQNLYVWGATWLQSITGGVAPTASSAIVGADKRWTWGWEARAGNPAAGSTWNATYGTQNLNYVSGTWNEVSKPASISLAAVGSNAIYFDGQGTNGPCWHQAGTGDLTWDIPRGSDIWVRIEGRIELPASGTYYLVWWYGNARTNNEWYLYVLNNGNLGAVHNGSSGGGTNQTFARSSLIPATPEYSLIDVYFDARGAASNGAGITTICYNGSCASQTAAGDFGGFETGKFSIGAFNCSANATFGNMGKYLIAIGETARSQWTATTHQQDYQALCPSPPCY